MVVVGGGVSKRQFDKRVLPSRKRRTINLNTHGHMQRRPSDRGTVMAFDSAEPTVTTDTSASSDDNTLRPVV